MKKIVINVYYLDSARYFHYIANCLRRHHPKLSIQFVSFFPSAHRFLLEQGEQSLFLGTELRGVVPASGNHVGLVSYHTAISDRFSEETLAAEAGCCLTLYREWLQDTSLLISAGDTRLQTEAAIQAAKELRVPILYFEQGAFGTTILDTEGVNANVSFRGKLVESDGQYQAIEDLAESKPAYTAHRTVEEKLFEKLDLFYFYPLPFCQRRVPLYAQTGDSFLDFLKVRRTNKQRAELDVTLPAEFVFVPLQMPNDAQLIYHSPLYQNFADILRDVSGALPEGVSAVVREHPNYRGRYASELYRLLAETDNLHLINDSNLNDTIDQSLAVITVNSSIGIEALQRQKKVLLLGNAYYEHDLALHKLDDRSQIAGAIQKLLKTPFNQAAVSQLIATLIEKHLLPGHFRDHKLSGGDIMAEKILNTMN